MLNRTVLDQSALLASVIPSGIYQNSENFVLFLKAYYDWLQTTKIKFENAQGTFSVGETIVGSISNANAKVQLVGTDYLVVSYAENYIQKDFFDRTDNIVGQSSGATASIVSVEDNIMRKSANLLDYRDITKSIDVFSDYLKDEFYYNIPYSIVANKETSHKKVRDLFITKGQEDSVKYLMQSLYNQEVDISYPGDEILRVSDGKFLQRKIIRVNYSNLVSNNEDIFSFRFKTITGKISGAIAFVSDVSTINFDSGLIVGELILTNVSGSFQRGERVYSIDDPLQENGNYVVTYGILSDYDIVSGGSGYVSGQFLPVIGDGNYATVKVNEIYTSGIDSIKINSVGHGYRLNTLASVDNTGTGGSNLIIKVTEIKNTYTVTSGANTYTLGEISKVSILNKGSGYTKEPTITLIDSEIASLGLLSGSLIAINNPGTNYTVGDAVVFTGGSGVSAAGEVASISYANTDYDIFLEDGTNLISELTSDYIKYDRTLLAQPVWPGVGPISRVRMINYGTGYTNSSLPAISVTTSTGSSANLVATGIQGTRANISVDTANNTGGIGAIKSIEIVDVGINYTNAVINGSVHGNVSANITPIIGGLGTVSESQVNDDGKLNYKKIQDSFYYQTYSYVIKSGIEIDTYREVLKNLVHPAGVNLFGQITIVSEMSVTMNPESLISIKTLADLIMYLISSFKVTASSAGRSITLGINSDINTFKGKEKTVYFGEEVSLYYMQQQNSPYAAYTFLTPFPGYVYPISTANVNFIVHSKAANTYPVDLPPNYINYGRVEVIPNTLNLTFDMLGPNGTPILFGSFLLSTYQSNTVTEYSNTTFDTLTNPQSYTDIIEKQLKITGTVSYYSANNTILGSSTTFLSDFSANSYIVIEDNKYRINTVSSNTVMTILVGSSTNQLNKSAYKIVY